MRVLVAAEIEGLGYGPEIEIDWPVGLSLPTEHDLLILPPFRFEVQRISYEPFAERTVATIVVFVRPEQADLLVEEKGWIR